MKILIQFPTRERPDKFINYLSIYIDLLENKKNYQIHISCDINDSTMNNDKMKEKISHFANTEISFNDNQTKVQAINIGVSEKKWDILILASDDMLPIVEGYDNIIRELFKKHFPDGDGVLHFNDGHRGSGLNTLCILDRKYYDRFGYIYQPSYKSMCCDDEFDEVSRILNKRIYIDQVIIKHEHPDANKAIIFDKLYQKNDIPFLEDRNTLYNRKIQNFGL